MSIFTNIKRSYKSLLSKLLLMGAVDGVSAGLQADCKESYVDLSVGGTTVNAAYNMGTKTFIGTGLVLAPAWAASVLSYNATRGVVWVVSGPKKCATASEGPGEDPGIRTKKPVPNTLFESPPGDNRQHDKPEPNT